MKKSAYRRSAQNTSLNKPVGKKNASSNSHKEPSGKKSKDYATRPKQPVKPKQRSRLK